MSGQRAGRSGGLLLVCAVFACGGGEAEEPVGTPYSADAVLDPSSPDTFVHVLTHAMTEQRPQEVWRALPDEYRKDVQSLLDTFTARMDADVYDRGFQLLARFARVLSEQKEFLVKTSSQMAMMMPAASQGANWDAMADALQTLTASEIATFEGLRKLDVDAFLSTTGARLLNRMTLFGQAIGGADFNADMEEVKKLRTSVVSSSGDVAIVRVTMPGEPPQEEAMIRVGGVWLPGVLADDWSSTITEIRAAIESIDLAEKKPAVMAMMDGFDTALDGLLAATSEDEFKQGMTAMQQQIMRAMMGGALAEAMSGEAQSPADQDP